VFQRVSDLVAGLKFYECKSDVVRWNSNNLCPFIREDVVMVVCKDWFGWGESMSNEGKSVE
jgi:hypothetical protein